MIFDDKQKDLDKIKNAVENTSVILNIIETTSKIEVVNYLMFHNCPSLFILDIIAEQKTVGFELCESILSANKRNLVLFITNYPECILYNTDYKLDSVCFILKNNKRLNLEIKAALERCIAYLDDTNYYSIYTKTEGIIKVHYNDIYFFEKKNGTAKTCIYYKDGQIEFRKSLKQIVAELNFLIKCHGSYAVNPEKIEYVIKLEKKIILKDGYCCYYSEKYQRFLKEWLK